MANQSLVSVPPNIEDPVVLRRFLSRLIEQLDIVLGNRSGVNNRYVRQEDLVVRAETLAELLESAQVALERALDNIDELDDVVVEGLINRIKAIEDKDAAQDQRVTALESKLNNVVPQKAVMLSFTVNGLGNPSLLINFNVNTATRVSTGLYQFSVSQQTISGYDVLDNSIKTLSWFITPDSISELFQVTYVSTATPGTFRLQVNALVIGLTNVLEVQPYDLQAGDTVDLAALYNTPNSVLPSSIL